MLAHFIQLSINFQQS